MSVPMMRRPPTLGRMQLLRPRGRTSLDDTYLVTRTLIDACCGRPVDWPRDRYASSELVMAARHHRIAPLVHAALRPATVVAPLQQDREAAIVTHLRALSTLTKLDRILGADIPWVTFKGPALSELAHPVPGLRTYHDVDVLVSPTRLREATGRLLEAGWLIADFEDMLLNPATPGETHWVSPAGIMVDLHWSMLNMASRRRHFQVDTDALLARRVRRASATAAIWTLNPPDALVHVCLHAALAGANRLLFLLDAHHLTLEVDDWDVVLDRARTWGAEPQLMLVLARTHRFIGTEIPRDLASRGQVPWAMRQIGSLVDGLAPTPAARRDAGMARLYARAIRTTTATSLAACVRNGALGVQHRLRTDSAATPRIHNAEAVEQYLLAVERQCTVDDFGAC